MEDTTMTKTARLVADAYSDYHPQVLSYLYYRTGNRREAEDLSQDTFLRLMDYARMLRPETIRHFIFTIARNLLQDYLRRHYKKQDVYAHVAGEMKASSDDTESRLIAKDLLACERRRLSRLPSRRRIIYIMTRFDGKTVPEISAELNLSRRTVENHLCIGRREIRSYIEQCI